MKLKENSVLYCGDVLVLAEGGSLDCWRRGCACWMEIAVG